MTERRRPAPKTIPTMGGGGPRGPRGMGPRQPLNKQALKRLLGYLKPYWPRLLVVLLCIVISAVVTALAASFIRNIIDTLETMTTPETLSNDMSVVLSSRADSNVQADLVDLSGAVRIDFGVYYI